jgi:hypothetical protein
MENRLYGLYPAVRVKLMDSGYSSIREHAIRQVWQTGGTRHMTDHNPCRFIGDCDEMAFILRGWLEQKYPSTATGVVSGTLKNGQPHVEVVFWNGEGFCSFNPETGISYRLTARFAEVRLVVM